MNNNTVFHEFEVDKAIISDLIHAQNGTISTALRELVMNAIDAGSTCCDIKLNSTYFSIKDNGEGFKSKENIERVFKRFGEPHKEGDAIFGRFRIGRGQIMSFGKIIWHSNTFKMHTDVRKFGNGFNLIENQVDYSGCIISGKFYEPLGEWDLKNIKEEITNLVKYANLTITLNGIDITQTQCTTWDIDDDDVKIKWSPNRRDGIRLYSLGVFVKELHRYRYGFDADIVTKRALKLNMAR
ncbi:ATP-binding protein, partial [Photobacterium damselae]|uniref:ATP-binding protein n=1 Tax=Photobacterium damselae TaxID=38293 RepID=UPI0035A8A55B